MKTLIALAAAAVSFAAQAPANAAPTVSYDIVAAFTPVPQSSTLFRYGYSDPTTGQFTDFDSTSLSCAGIGGLTCQYSNGYNLNELPAVGRAFAGASGGTVSVPSNVLFMHPIDTTTSSGVRYAPGDAIVRFTAPTTGNYNISGMFSVLDTANASNGTIDSIVGGYSTFSSLLVGPYGTSNPFNFNTALRAGATLDFIVNANGSYDYDSTGLSGTITSNAVPEAGTWAMLIIGLGGIGYEVRRRKAALRLA